MIDLNGFFKGIQQWTGLIALLLPALFIYIDRHMPLRWSRMCRVGVFLLYIFLILRLTLIGRSPDMEKQFQLTPFWTYELLNDAQYRWEILQNIFVFIPFGFLLPWALRRPFWQSLLIGLLFSASIETVQYFFHLGMAEFDDVFHNTLGTVLGFGYWKILR